MDTKDEKFALLANGFEHIRIHQSYINNKLPRIPISVHGKEIKKIPEIYLFPSEYYMTKLDTDLNKKKGIDLNFTKEYSLEIFLNFIDLIHGDDSRLYLSPKEFIGLILCLDFLDFHNHILELFAIETESLYEFEDEQIIQNIISEISLYLENNESNALQDIKSHFIALIDIDEILIEEKPIKLINEFIAIDELRNMLITAFINNKAKDFTENEKVDYISNLLTRLEYSKINITEKGIIDIINSILLPLVDKNRAQTLKSLIIEYLGEEIFGKINKNNIFEYDENDNHVFWKNNYLLNSFREENIREQDKDLYKRICKHYEIDLREEDSWEWFSIPNHERAVKLYYKLYHDHNGDPFFAIFLRNYDGVKIEAEFSVISEPDVFSVLTKKTDKPARHISFVFREKQFDIYNYYPIKAYPSLKLKVLFHKIKTIKMNN